MVMDLWAPPSLSRVMTSDDIAANRMDLVNRLFALLTTHAEDAAAVATRGQASGLGFSKVSELTGEIAAHAEAMQTIAAAADVIASHAPSERRSRRGGDV